ncbi:MAG: substrate-binding domain-containing protein [Cyanobacteria bacterium J06621_11]
MGGVISGCSPSNSAAVISPSVDDVSSVIAIGGSAETYETFERLAEAYEAKTAVEFNFFPPSQTSSGIEGVKNGSLDIGGVSRVLAEEDTGAGLTYLPLVSTPLVVVVHDSVADVSDMSADQLRGIYSGEINNWRTLGGPDAEIVLFDLSEDESEKQLLRKAYLGDDFKVSSNAISFAEDDEMLETAAITDFSIAAVPLEDELEDLPVTILSIDGVFPKPETLRSGEYRMALPLGLTVSKSLTPETQAFIDFINSDEGQRFLTDDD